MPQRIFLMLGVASLESVDGQRVLRPIAYDQLAALSDPINLLPRRLAEARDDLLAQLNAETPLRSVMIRLVCPDSEHARCPHDLPLHDRGLDWNSAASVIHATHPRSSVRVAHPAAKIHELEAAYESPESINLLFDHAGRLIAR